MINRSIILSGCLLYVGPEGKGANIVKRLFAFTALSLFALAGTAQADSKLDTSYANDKLDAYSTCWANAATSYLNEHGTTEDNLRLAPDIADQRCMDARISAGNGEGAASDEEIREMRDYMAVQLVNANPVPKLSLEDRLRREKYPNLKPVEPNYMTNAGDAFLCLYASDVSNARQLVQTGRTEMVAQIQGCTPVTTQIAVEPIDQFGGTLQVRVTLVDGRIFTAWTSSLFFKYEYAWN